MRAIGSDRETDFSKMRFLRQTTISGKYPLIEHEVSHHLLLISYHCQHANTLAVYSTMLLSCEFELNRAIRHQTRTSADLYFVMLIVELEELDYVLLSDLLSRD